MLSIAILVPWLAASVVPDEPNYLHPPIISLSEGLAADGPQPGWPIAHGEPYLRLGNGLVRSRNSPSSGTDADFDSGLLFDIAIGQRLPGAFGHGPSEKTGPIDLDLDIEGVFTRQDSGNSGNNQAVDDVGVAAFLFNGTADMRVWSKLSIYAGLGLGPAWLDVNTSNTGGSTFDSEDGPFLAWQFRTGAEWQLTDGITGLVGLRSLNVGDAHVDDSTGGGSFDLSTHQRVLEVGVRFRL